MLPFNFFKFLILPCATSDSAPSILSTERHVRVTNYLYYIVGPIVFFAVNSQQRTWKTVKYRT